MAIVETLSAKRVGYDIDDTLIDRGGLARFLGFIREQFSDGIPDYSLGSIPDLNHEPISKRGINPESLWFHCGRKGIPGVAERLKIRTEKGEQAFAISGRLAATDWHEETVRQLAREGFPISKDRVILTPRGVQTFISKAHAIQALGIEQFSDDDLRTQLILSALFPDVGFNWISYRPINGSVNNVLLAARGNLRVVPIEKWMNSGR